MKIKNKNKQISFQINSEVSDLYQKKYPYTLSIFLRKCVEKALKSKDFFDTVYFEDNIYNLEVK